MTYREILHTCSHAEVARAAVDSLGGEIALKVAAEASRRSISRGALVSQLVRHFAASAGETDLQAVNVAAHKSQVPLLSGLRYILEREIASEVTPAWMIADLAKAI